MSEPPKGRIAIKFGSTASQKTSKPSRTAPSSTLGKRPRSHALGADSDSEPDNDHHHQKHEAITGFGANGAESKHKKQVPKKEYVIAKQANRDWRGELKAQRKPTNQDHESTDREPADQDKGLTWGLTIKEKTDQPTPEPHESPEPETAPKPRSADEEALDALLGNKPKETKVITTEDDVYKRDAEAAGVASTLEDYEAMPVEEFGAALLRGMGWDGEHRGPKVKDVRKRQNRLGLGAKELKGVEDLGGWNQGSKKRRPRLDEYRREESKRKEGRGREDSYKRERERDRERDRYRDDRGRHRDDRDRRR
ncbi:DExH-box splicing factor binding site domain-containing protein [Pochonia chlamydosporia 170]|uniref:Pre-mRNA-splicing factor n=1 Tax=Pochonia chlamydosporia 170 TaxID=1380566 RepID=A0A179FS07_METCM|nr:DExH-box splicing factor binding site domain-containing protein [Pochonia chlamydosporia 170]OAQ68038.1 DExH-box splicing factor binding site domain-containing protein [Pochonia chlamydosporia 170]